MYIDLQVGTIGMMVRACRGHQIWAIQMWILGLHFVAPSLGSHHVAQNLTGKEKESEKTKDDSTGGGSASACEKEVCFTGRPGPVSLYDKDGQKVGESFRIKFDEHYAKNFNNRDYNRFSDLLFDFNLLIRLFDSSIIFKISPRIVDFSGIVEVSPGIPNHALSPLNGRISESA